MNTKLSRALRYQFQANNKDEELIDKAIRDFIDILENAKVTEYETIYMNSLKGIGRSYIDKSRIRKTKENLNEANKY